VIESNTLTKLIIVDRRILIKSSKLKNIVIYPVKRIHNFQLKTNWTNIILVIIVNKEQGRNSRFSNALQFFNLSSQEEVLERDKDLF